MNKKLLVLAAAGILSSAAFGASGLKPGLWEVTTQTELPGGMAMPNMANLPPDVAAKMAQRGITLQGGGGITARTCITREQAAKDEPPQPPDSRCRNTSFKKTGNTITWQMACVDGKRAMNGKGSMTLSSPESYSGNSSMTVNDPEHGFMTTTTRMQGHWVGNCQ
jgi:hypothetical protein